MAAASRAKLRAVPRFDEVAEAAADERIRG
jgi:hypothetical protein